MKSNRKAGPAGRRKRREFSAEFKAEEVRLVSERRAAGVSLTPMGRELDVRPDELRGWARQQGRESGAASAVLGETVEQENRRRRRENAVPCQEQAFAKQVAVYVAFLVAVFSVACADPTTPPTAGQVIWRVPSASPTDPLQPGPRMLQEIRTDLLR